MTVSVPLGWDGRPLADVFPAAFAWPAGSAANASRQLLLQPGPAAPTGGRYFVELRMRCGGVLARRGLSRCPCTDRLALALPLPAQACSMSRQGTWRALGRLPGLGVPSRGALRLGRRSADVRFEFATQAFAVRDPRPQASRRLQQLRA